jgi:hypothetical protein
MYPEPESEEAREGTAAHHYVTEAMQGRVWPVGTLAPNGVTLTEEMHDCGEVFLDYVAGWGAVQWFVERKLTMHALVHPECEGTPDAYHVDFAAHRIAIVDYKYGHRYVDPWRNAQGVNYIAGVLEAHGLTRDDVKGWEIVFAVIQPRNFHSSGPVREWRALGWQVWEAIDAMREAAYRAKEPNAATKTGPWCRDCSGRHACEALRRVGAYALDLAGSSIPSELSDDALGLQLRHIRAAQKRLEALLSGLEADALARIRRGEKLAGLAIQHGQGRETWNTTAETVLATADAFGINLRKEALLTPKQALKAGMDPDLVKAFAHTPSGEAKVVEVDASAVARAFSR